MKHPFSRFFGLGEKEVEQVAIDEIEARNESGKTK